MIDFSSNPAYYNKPVPKERLFGAETITDYGIADVQWLMSIKPGIRNVQKYISDRERMEEIEVFSVRLTKLPDKGFHERMLKEIHRTILYPCVVILQYEDKVKYSAWKFVDSVASTNPTVLKSYYISSWIHETVRSEKLRSFSERIWDLLLNGEGSIKDIYNQICSCILDAAPQFIGSRNHLQKIICDFTGQKNDPILKEIPYSLRYDVRPTNSQYKKREYYSSFKYCYEYEEIWHVFMGNDRIRRIIEKRRYSDASEMILKIDMKYEDQETW